MTRAAVVMLVYAAVMVGIGVLAFVVAPPGAAAGTALAVPGVAGVLMAACAVLSLLRGRARMVGAWGGIVLPALLAAAFALRAAPAMSDYLDARAAVEAAEAPAPEAVAALGKGYLVMTLWGLAGLSVLAFASVMMVARPGRGMKGEPVASEVNGRVQE